jgi:hypothetical protein
MSLVAVAILIAHACGESTEPAGSDTGGSSPSRSTGADDGATSDASTSSSIAESSSADDGTTVAESSDGGTSTGDASTGPQGDSGSTGESSDYEPLCMALAEKLASCYPEVDPVQQFEFCIGEIEVAGSYGEMCVKVTVGLFTCRSELTCEELDADGACAVYDGMLDAYC